MCQNILFPGFKGEKLVPTYYLLPANIYGLGINYASNNICSVYNWTEFEGNKGMDNIASCLFRWLNAKGYYYQSYGKNNKTPKITIIFDNCGGHNKNNVMILFLNMIKEGELFGTDNLHLYIKGHTNNDPSL